ncbi:MAG: diaminopimelate decarboxylase [Alphaproteobacteria bacterium]|nr:MAG: diaminopimelate decarboxylase [Alphaproteobacteria bacterium]
MHHFEYKKGVLHAEDVSIPEIAAEVGTPFYCYSSATLRRHYQVFANAFKKSQTLVCFSVKSNSNLSVIRTLAREGAGADIVSAGELHRALKAGIPPEKIVFSGVGKTRDELAFALKTGILQFNVESRSELEALNQVALEQNRKAPISFRVNPDVDASTHEKISTGKKENKFGILWEEARAAYDRAAALPGIEIVGIDVHIGSQITNLDPFSRAFQKVIDLVKDLRAQGHAITNVDLGGGLGINYKAGNEPPPHPEEYARMIETLMDGLQVRLLFEPGRMIVGNAGILVSRVIYRKSGADKTFVIADAAMNDLVRPTLYDAHHDIIAVKDPGASQAIERVDVVGPVCESGDAFAKDRDLPPLEEGDLMAILSAGAYGAVQSNTYNSRLLVPEVLVDGREFAVIRQRPSYEDLLALDKVAPWLK